MIHIEDLCAPEAVPEKARAILVSDESPIAYKVYRLFTGQCRLSCEITERSCDIKEDAISLFYSNDSKNFISTITNYIIEDYEGEEEKKVSLLANNIANPQLSYRNKSYFQELYNELCNYHFAINANNYIAAFTHEYRIIEYIAYAYPLIYATRTQDFYRTFGHLKEYINNQGKGELGFFKKAINAIFHKSDILSTSLNISLKDIDNPGIKEAYSKILKNNIKSEWQHEDTTDDLFAIKFNEVGSVLIELRNKIFHHSINTPNNILADQLLNINFFMTLMVPGFFSWLGVVYIEIFKSILPSYK